MVETPQEGRVLRTTAGITVKRKPYGQRRERKRKTLRNAECLLKLPHLQGPRVVLGIVAKAELCRSHGAVVAIGAPEKFVHWLSSMEVEHLAALLTVQYREMVAAEGRPVRAEMGAIAVRVHLGEDAADFARGGFIRKQFVMALTLPSPDPAAVK